VPFQPKNCKLCNAPPVNHNRSPMAFLHILIVDDHAVVRKNVRSLVEKFSDWEVCAEAADGWEAIEKTREWQPNLVLMDINMPNLNGLDATREIVQRDPHVRVLILTVYAEENMSRAAQGAGAHGFLCKCDLAENLPKAIEALTRGETFFPLQSVA